MRKLILALSFAVALGLQASGQTKEPSKSTKQGNKAEVSKSGSNCCSPSSKAKAMLQGKRPAFPKKD